MKRIFVPTMGPSDWRRLLADPEKQWKPGVNRVLTASIILTVRCASIIMITTTSHVHGAAPSLTDQGVLIRQIGNTSMGMVSSAFGVVPALTVQGAHICRKKYTSINELAASALVTI